MATPKKLPKWVSRAAVAPQTPKMTDSKRLGTREAIHKDGRAKSRQKNRYQKPGCRICELAQGSKVVHLLGLGGPRRPGKPRPPTFRMGVQASRSPIDTQNDRPSDVTHLGVQHMRRDPGESGGYHAWYRLGLEIPTFAMGVPGSRAPRTPD